MPADVQTAGGGGDTPPQEPDPLAAALAELEEERRRRAELQALFDLVVEAVSDAVVLVDGTGRVSAANRVATRLTGRTVEELAAETVHTFSPVPPDSAAAVTCSVLRAADGHVVAGVYTTHDRSEEQHLVDLLGEAEDRLRLLAELGDLLGREVDPLETLPRACERLARATGTAVAVILVTGGGTAVDRVVAWPSDGAVAATLNALTSRPLERGSALWTVVHHSRSVHVPAVDGSTPLFGPDRSTAGIGSATLVPLVSGSAALGALLVHAPEPEGVPARLLTVLEEAAGRVALALANDQLRATLSHLKAAEEAGRYREELLAAASHDMQTPLAVLLGSVSALRAGASLPAAQRALLLERMARRGAQLRLLVQQFLDYSRLEAGRPLVVRPVLSDLGAAISAVEAVVAGRRRLEVDMPDGLPPAVADLDRLEQVLGNLVSNAMKFSPEGSPITVRARATPDTVEVEVVDRGRGMGAEDLARAFEKFHRGDGAAGTQGTGLGLYMSRALVEAQGGRLTAESTLGEGSRFTVVLPRRASPPEDADLGG